MHLNKYLIGDLLMKLKAIVFSLFVLIGVYSTSLIVTNSAKAYSGHRRFRRYVVEFRCRRGGLRRYFKKYGHLRRETIRARHRDHARRRIHPRLRDICGGRGCRIENVRRVH
jgi:hypothetical protein